MSAPDSHEFRPGCSSGATAHTVTERERLRSAPSFRFLQTSELRLDTPCYGVTGVPDVLRKRLAESRFVAAERVFDIALQRDVDFVVLAGGLLDAGLPGLRGPWFLTEQFQRLADRDIDVYWAGAAFETRRRWPAYVELPTNVHRLTADATGILHGRDGHPFVRLLTIQAPGVPHVQQPDVFTIAVQPQCAATPESFVAGINFWALGGQSEHETVQLADVVAHFAGSPQGRSPGETGVHSCSVIDVSADRSVRIQPITTDVVRWHDLRLTIDSRTQWSELNECFVDRLADLKDASDIDLNLVTWTVQGEGLAFQRLLEPHLRAEFIDRLNHRTADSALVTWTTDIRCLVDTEHRERLQRTDSPLGKALTQLHELAPHVDELFGTPLDDDHPLGTLNESELNQLIEQVVTEAAFRFGNSREERVPNV